MSATGGASQDKARARLGSWKEISAYMEVSVRTAQRWEAREKLPVLRHHHETQGTVYAFSDELDAWLRERSAAGRPATPPASEPAPAPASRWEDELKAARARLESEPIRVVDGERRADSVATVGRDEQVQELVDALEEVHAGVRLICVAGEAGIGKTTLLGGFRRALETTHTDVRVAAGRCSERLAGSEAYLPVLEMLDDLTAGASSPAADLLRLVAPTWYIQIAPLWSTADPTLAQVIGDARAASSERLKREMAAYLRELTAAGPLVLLLDDLHWADPSTVELISYLCFQRELEGLLIAGSYRTTEMSLAGHPFLRTRQELENRGLCRELEMSLLGESEVKEYLDLKYPGHRCPPGFAEAVHQRSGGNPLFMTDLIRDLERREVLVQGDGGWQLASSLEEVRLGLPGSIRGLIDQQLAPITERERGLLTAAAVYGEEFESTVLSSAVGESRVATEEALQRLESVFLVVRLLAQHELPDGQVSRRYRFSHVLYQNVLFRTIPPAQISELSGAVADAMLEHYGSEANQVAGELALLFEQARRFQLATDYFLLAARNAASVYANKEAISLTERAARNAKRLPPKVRIPRILAASFELAQLHLTLSDFESAARDFRAAEQAAAELGDREQQIEAICGGALAIFNRKRLDETRAMGERALAIAEQASSVYGTASAQIVLAMERMSHGYTTEAADLVSRAQPVLMSASPEPAPMHAIEGVSYCAAHFGWQANYEEAFPPIEWALERARARGVCFHIVCCLFIKGLGFGGAGYFTSSQECLEEGARLAELNSERYWLPRLPNTLGWIHGEMQDYDASFRMNTEGTSMALEMGFSEGAINAHTNLAGLHIAQGELDRAWEHLVKARRLTEDEHWFRWVYVVRLEVQFARYWIAKGDLEAARRHARAVLDIAEPARKAKHVALGHQLFGDIARLEDRPERAVEGYRAALEAIEVRPCPSAEWRILQSLADVRRKLGQADEASDALARARAVVDLLAERIQDSRLRRMFERSEAVSSLRS